MSDDARELHEHLQRLQAAGTSPRGLLSGEPTEDQIREHMERLHRPDGRCYYCGAPADRFHPIGPIVITVSDPDIRAGVSFVFGNVSPTGPPCRAGESSSPIADSMRVIRGMHGDRVVYIFSTNQTRGGFEVAADFDLEGIPFGASTARFIHIWHTDIQVPAELTDRPLMWRELVAHHPEILAELGAEHERQIAEGQAAMEAANRPRRHGAESARTTKPAPRGADQPDLFGAGAKRRP